MVNIQKNFKSYLRKVDIFGIPIQIHFKSKSQYQTRFGGVISLLVFILIISIFSSILIKIISKSNLQIIQEELQTISPPRYEFTKDNFSFALAILDGENYLPKTEGYFDIIALQEHKVVYQDQNGNTKYKFEQMPLNLEKCSNQSFQVKGTENYFLQQDYQHFHCIDNSQQMNMEGNFESNSFSFIQILISKCAGDGCKTDDEITKRQSSSILQVHYTNYQVKLTNYEKPFEAIGQGGYWVTNLTYQQCIELKYKHVYLQDDIGFFYSQTENKKQIIYSQTKLSQMLDTSKEKY